MTASEPTSPPPEWDHLEPDPPLFASRGWLTTMGHRLEGAHRYVVDAQRRVGLFGSVVADSAVTATKNPWDLLFDPLYGLRTLSGAALDAQARLREQAPRRQRWFPALAMTYPGLECYPLGPGARDPADLDRAVARVLALAHAEGVRTVAFLYVQPRHPEFAAALARAGFARVPAADHAILRLPGSGFGDYLRLIGKHAREDVARIRRRLAASGVSVSRFLLSNADEDLLDTLVGLRAEHRAKYGKPPDDLSERRQLLAFRQGFGDRARVYVARTADRIVGFCLFLDAGDIQHCWLTGADYADPRARHTYFEMCYHAPVEAAYGDGTRAISFGYGMADVKRRRGCELETIHSYVRALDDSHQVLVERLAATLDP